MKKAIIFLFGLLVVPFWSCDSLNLAPEDYYGSNSFWKSEAQVQGFMVGMHNNLRSNYTRYFTQGEARGGTLVSGNSIVNTSQDMSSPIKDNTFTVNSTGIGSWNGIYNSLMQVNLFLDKVTNECPFLTDAQRKGYLAVGHAFRALHYFMLYRTYGGVPLVTTVKVLEGQVTAEKLYTPRATPKQIMDFIKDEIQKSEEFYGTSTTIDPSKALWSPYATQMLKAEVYMWSAKVTTGNQLAGGATDLNVAKTALEKVLAGPFSLMANFADVFTVKNAGNTEAIFSLRFLDKEATNFGSTFISADNVFINQVYGRDGKMIAKDTLNTRSTGLLRHTYKFGLWASYDAADKRRDATFLDFYTKAKVADVAFNKGGTVLRKMLGSINVTGDRVYTTDWIVYRLSDAYLMMAEVKNGLNQDPSTEINAVRRRAYGPTYPVYTNSGFAANELAILFERDKEFVCEGKRWFDIVRMRDASGKSLCFSAVVNYTDNYPAAPATTPVIDPAKAYMLLWPVDVNTLNNDPLLEQTPDYPKQ